MQWTYSGYIGMNVGVGIGLFIFTVFVVLILAFGCGAHSYIIDRVIDIKLKDPKEDNNKKQHLTHLGQLKRSPDSQEKSDTITIHNHTFDNTHKRYKCLSVSFVLMCAIVVGIMPVLMFEGCILGSQGVDNGDSCPDDPMDCFVLEKNIDHTQRGYFQCRPGDVVNFTGIYADGYAWCYGWIVTRQTTKRVLDQLGICAGLIAIFAVIFALLVYISTKPVMYFISAALVVLCVIAAILLIAIYRWALSFLTYISLGVCLIIAIWSLVLVCILGFWKRADNKPKPLALSSSRYRALGNRRTRPLP